MPSPEKRFLKPREHGAWGQMAMPLATGLALGRPDLAAWLFTAAAILVFLAQEPARVLLGARGEKARAEDGPLARRQLALLAAGFLPTGVVALWLAPPGARLAAAVPAALGTAALWHARRRLELTTAGTALAGAAMASALLPVAVCAGVAARTAAAAFVIWALSFALASFAVEAVLARGRPGAPDVGRRNAALALGTFAFAAGLARLLSLPLAAPASLAPTAFFCAAACLGGVGPARLRAIGWGLVGSTAATLGVLIAGLRN